MKKLLSILLAITILMSLGTAFSVSYAAEEAEDGVIHYYNDFNTESDLSQIVFRSEYPDVERYLDTVEGNSVHHVVGNFGGSGFAWYHNYLNSTVLSSAEVGSKPDIVLEYRVRSEFPTADSRIDTYRNENIYYNSSRTVAFYGNSSYPVTWNQDKQEPINDKSYNPSDWNTVTVVLHGDKATRTVYINGELIGESGKGKEENRYYSTGKVGMMIYAMMNSKDGVVDTDYVKVFEPASEFTAKLVEIGEYNSITVEFNQTPAPAKLIAENISIFGGTAPIGIKEIKRLNETTYTFMPDSALEPGAQYSLDLSKLTDTLEKNISTSSISFTSLSEKIWYEENSYYYNSFATPMVLNHDNSRPEGKNEFTFGTAADGSDVFRIRRLDTYNYTGTSQFRFPVVAPEDSPSELVLEYKIKCDFADPASFVGVWPSTGDLNRPKTVSHGGEGFANKIRFHYQDSAEIKEGFEVNDKEWNTVTVVYPGDKGSREVYVNGSYLGTSPVGATENTYYSNGEIMYTPIFELYNPADVIEYDYVRVYERSMQFDARINDAKADAITVEFNSTPANFTAENISISGGAAIREIKAIDEKNYVIIPAEDLVGEASLDVSRVKDTLGRAIATASISFSIAEEIAAEEKVYLYYEFDDVADIGSLTTSNCVTPTVNVSSDGKSVLRLENTVEDNKNASGYFWFDEDMTKENDKNSYVLIENAPVVVLEYKVRMAESCYSADYFTTRPASEQSVAIGGAKAYIDKIRPNTSADSNIIGTLDQSDWSTITTVYSNTDGSRRVYVNGEFVAEINKDVAGYVESVYSTSGYTQFKPHLCAFLKNKGDYCEVDYIKLYALPASASIENVTVSDGLKTAYLDFNAALGTLSEEMIKVGGLTPVKVELYDAEKYIYSAELPEKLPAGKEIDVFANNAETLDGQSVYVAETVTTRAAKEIKVVVNGDDSLKGEISVNGVAGVTATVFEDSDVTINVRPYINYSVTVTADGNNLVADRLDNYIVRDIDEDTEITVTFSDVTETPASIETISEAYVDELSVYAFGVLRKSCEDYGIIVAASRNNLTLEAVEAGNARKFQAAKGISKYGEYGIQLIDIAKHLGTELYIIPYAVYGDKPVYGTPVGASR